ncbi:hypothetical protein K3495_g563 [Podosphaera aphanis]|nr:hypothetical protein K3495_g563 [Podosphaera aphanis]
MDLVESLVHDVEKAWDSKQVCTLTSLDIESAFDSIQPGRLSARLREQRWPIPYVKWAASFASGRKARLRVDNFVGEFLDIPHGLPQGSPASPILFLLFLEPLFKYGFPTFGYVDDVAILSVAKTLVESSRLTAIRVETVTQWCNTNGLSLAENKMEILHLHRSRQLPLPLTIYGVSRDVSSSVNWLGVFLDTKLSFKEHVQEWCAKTQRISAHIRHLGNTNRGIPIVFLRNAALAAALPVLLYGAEVRWRGHTYLRRGLPTSTRFQNLIDMVSRALVTLVRAILPVYKTMPTPALLREVWIKPAHILLEEIRLRSAVRLAAADCFHPELPPWDILVFSDGSKQKDGSAGAGAVVLHRDIKLAEVKVPLGPDFEVYDSEIIGALAGHRAATAAPSAHLATNINVILDKQEAAQRLLVTSPSKSSQKEILEYRDLASRWPRRRILPIASPGRV